jgi:hypothetical protein
MSLARAALAASCIALAACGGNDDPEGADALWKSIHDQSYTAFAKAPGYDVKRASSAPHGDEVIIYVNDVVASALAGEPITAWPEGSLIVKDGFSGGEPDIVAAMEKRADGWYWAEWSADGDAKFSGKPSTCTDCHESGADFVRAFGFPK